MPIVFEGDSSFEEFLGRVFGANGFGQQAGPRPINLFSLMNPRAQEVVRAAGRKAASLGSETIEDIHLLATLLEDPSVDAMLNSLEADKQAITDEVTKALGEAKPKREEVPQLGQSAQHALFRSAQIARALGSGRIEPEHVFYALMGSTEHVPGAILTNAGVTPDALRSGQPAVKPAKRVRANSKTPTLDQYGIDLTEQAAEGKLDPVIGRQNEISQTIEILLRRTKNNPVLIGEAGVGKTAVIEGIAQAIAADDVPDLLKNRRVISLDLPGMVAGSKFRGDFEERITKLIDEVVANKDEVILFLDEIHTVLGAGGGGDGGGMDAANILKPRLARGELHLIGATTLKEYRRIEKDAAFERRFQQVRIGEPSLTDAVLILQGIKANYEQHHNVTYTDEAITAAVDLSNRYITDRFLPDKAIDLIDQAGARKRILSGTTESGAELGERLAELEDAKTKAVAEERYEDANRLKWEASDIEARIQQVAKRQAEQKLLIREVDIAEIIARATGIPAARLTEDDRSRLSKLEPELHESVIGQDEGISAIAKAIRRSRSGLGDPTRPIGSFLFLGPTGVGKSQTAKTLAQNLFGSESAMIRFDMSEYAEKHTASRLVGAPPGYVGYEEAGQLTERVRRNPYSVVLLDEIEKAHPDIFNLLLQVLDDGRLTDGQGRTVDFRNTVLIMTSNLGSEFLASRSGAIGFVTSDATGFGSEDEVRARVMGKLRENMRPEFLNRIDEIVLFKKLALSEIKEITRLLLRDSEARLAAQGIKMSVPDEAVAWLGEHGYDPQYGARPLRRLIQREVDDKAADLIILGAVGTGGEIKLSVDEGKLYVSASEAEQTAAPELSLTKA